MKLPKASKSRQDVMKALRASMKDDGRWDEGRTFFLVYGVDEDHLAMLQEAYSLFIAATARYSPHRRRRVSAQPV